MHRVWITAFLFGNKDVMTEGDDYVREYKAAGGDKLLQVWSPKAETAKAEWEAIVGE